MNHAFRAQLFSHVVDTQGAAEAFAKLLKTSPRGRKKRSNPRTFLILMLLAAADGEVTIEHMHQIATRGLPRNIQRDLDILRPTPRTPRRLADPQDPAGLGIWVLLTT